MWTPTNDDILEIIALTGAKPIAKRVAHYTSLVPILYDVGAEWTNSSFDMTADSDKAKQAAIKLFIAKAAQYHELTVGLIGRKMGSVSYSFTEDMPKSVYNPLKPYRKVRW